METLTVCGVVEEIIYNNSDNGYTVCDIDSIDNGLFTATGYMPYISEGESVSLTGCWTTHTGRSRKNCRNKGHIKRKSKKSRRGIS